MCNISLSLEVDCTRQALGSWVRCLDAFLIGRAGVWPFFTKKGISSPLPVMPYHHALISRSSIAPFFIFIHMLILFPGLCCRSRRDSGVFSSFFPERSVFSYPGCSGTTNSNL